VKDVALRNPLPAKLFGVDIVSDFEDTTLDYMSLITQKFLDVIPVDRTPSIKPILATDGRQTPQIAHKDTTFRWVVGKVSNLSVSLQNCSRQNRLRNLL
jgi:hypothetical protein